MDKQITLGGRELFYREEGSGWPVLLLHGFAEDARVWNEIVGGIGSGYRVLAPHLPGSGGSDGLPGEASIEALAEVIKHFLDGLSIGSCVLVGHSMGGYIALAFAEKYPGRLKAVGFFHSTAYADTEEKRAARRKGIEFIRQYGAAPFIRQSTPNLFAAETREARPQLVEETIRNYSGFAPASLIYYYEAMIRRPDRLVVLRQFPGPILFIIGAKDTVVPYEHSLQQCQEPRVAQVGILEHAGHMGMLEEPAESCRILETFLNFVYHV